MPALPDPSKLSVRQFAERFRAEMIPLSNTFSYYCTSGPMSEEDQKEYLQEPVAALPPSVVNALPKIAILLVPYLERAGSAERKLPEASTASEIISSERPPTGKRSVFTQLQLPEETLLAFALEDQEMAEYHYRFYHQLASLMAAQWSEDAKSRYSLMLREELSADVHGEVDEASWRLKQNLRRGTGARSIARRGRAFEQYAKESFIDTLTLYLHGICCDIDVETGPRQLPSRFLRKRLLLLEELFPPPKGYAVFPERGE